MAAIEKIKSAARPARLGQKWTFRVGPELPKLRAQIPRYWDSSKALYGTIRRRI